MKTKIKVFSGKRLAVPECFPNVCDAKQPINMKRKRKLQAKVNAAFAGFNLDNADQDTFKALNEAGFSFCSPRGIRLIYATQEAVVGENLVGGTGALAEHLSRAPLDFAAGKIYHMRLFSHLRFLDIRYRRQDIKRQIHDQLTGTVA
ncbi:MAG: hypothetical protein LBD80_05440 [Tannerella sp.]|jgi:hypothetical protein|nr:hypothetical protein [Tannerella sp.]